MSGKLRLSWRRVTAILFLCLAALTAARAELPAPPELWFPVGEDLTYLIKWGFIPVGKTRAVTRWIEEDGRRLLAIRFRTRSNKVIATLYPVDDLIEAIIDPVTFLPIRFTKNMREGRHHNHEITIFDHENGVARWESISDKKSGQYRIDKNTRDILSFMYYMRARPLDFKKNEPFRVMADRKLYDLHIVPDKEERVKLPLFGKVPSLKVEPLARFHGLFVRKGRMWMWVSTDARRIITKIEAKVPVANIHVVLCSVHGPGDDSWIVETKKNADDACPEEADVEKALQEVD